MRRLVAVPVLALVAARIPAWAEPVRPQQGPDAGVTIKVATLAPEGTPWHRTLKQMDERFREATGGQVRLRIYPGGVAGNEGDMIRKCRLGQLQAAAVSAIGLREIASEPQAAMVPGVIDSYEELDYVMERITPTFDRIIADKGFAAIQWGYAGYVHFFTRSPARTPAEQAKLKIFAWTGDPYAVEAFKALKFKPVVLSSTDILPSLQTGLIEAVNGTPIFALSMSWHAHARYMTTVRWGIMIGATVVNRSTWEKIPAAQRDQLLAIARELGRSLDAEVRTLEETAIATMRKSGLTLVELTPEEMALWTRAAESTWPSLRDKVLPAATFDAVTKLRDEFRARRAAAKP